MTRADIVAYLKANLKPKRVEHSLGVERCAAGLAERYGADPKKAALAGLVHDCAKSLPTDVMIRYAEQAGFPVDDACRAASPFLLHAPAGLVVAREKLGIEDPEVLAAVCWHTVPRVDMTRLDKIVSLADVIEPNRDFEGVEDIRAAAETDLDQAFRLSLVVVMTHVLEKGLYLHPLSLQVYNELTLKLGCVGAK